MVLSTINDEKTNKFLQFHNNLITLHTFAQNPNTLIEPLYSIENYTHLANLLVDPLC